MIIAEDSFKLTMVNSGPSWLIVDKPCGVSIHNDPGNDLLSLVMRALEAGKVPGIRTGASSVHAVHRLDRDTSGIVLIATDIETRAFFSKQFADRTVRKEYLALVHGHLEGDATQPLNGEWNWPLTAGAAGRRNPMGKGKQLACATGWRVMAHSPHYSLVQCMPHSGRQHQIRRHAKLAGHPVVGDRRYGSMRALKFLSQHHRFNRLALHAHRLWIRLPEKDHPTMVASRGLPGEMQRLLESDQAT